MTNEEHNKSAAPQGVAYAELPEPIWRTAQGIAFSERQLYDFADRTHALRASNGQAPATQQAGEPVYAFRRRGQDDFCTCTFKRYTELSDFPEKFEMRIFYTAPQPLATQAPATQQAVGNSGFDHKTAADFLSGKTVSDEALRKFVAASRGAHDDRAALRAQMISLRGELASREAEIALLKRSLLDAEAVAPQPALLPRMAPRGDCAVCTLGIGGVCYCGPQTTTPSGAAESGDAYSVPAIDRARIREIFMAHGFTVKEGQTDLKQYVYDAADALLRAARASADSVLEDAARLDWIQHNGATVEVIPGKPSYDWCFRVAGLHATTRNNIRDAIDAARKQGGTQ